MDTCLSKTKIFLSLAVLLVGFFACSSSDLGQLSVSLTDSSTDQYNAVYVTIKQVDVHAEGATDGSWTTVAAPNKTVNLLTLVNGVREQLGLASLAAGHYTQLRLIIGDEQDSGVNILSQAHPYANYVIDDSNEYHQMKIPSGVQTGVKIVQGFDINENGTTELVLDFSASESVVVAGKSGKYLLKPTIKALPTTLAAIISGAVTKAADQSAVEGALVSAQVYNAQAADIRDQVVIQTSTLSDAAGAYKLFIAAGTYNLVAGKLGFAPLPAALTVAADTTPTQDFALIVADTGTVAGAAAITGGGSETYVTLSFRQTVSLGGSDVVIEILSVNVVNGGSYSVDLPVGAYSVVSSTSGLTTQQADVAVAKGATTTFDVTF
ncbi:MAG: DUF4382 domain-containing protein [Acidobacteriota bacterium]